MNTAPTLAELIRRALDSRLSDVHVALPGEIKTFDPLRQVCDVQPTVKRLVPDDDGFMIPESFPLIPNVPVVYPRTNLFNFYIPLTVGDTVLLVFTERPMAEWRTTGIESAPVDARMHGLNAIAIPGLFPVLKPMPITGVPDPHIGYSLGPKVLFTEAQVEVRTDMGISRSVALADLVATAFETLKTAFTTQAATLTLPELSSVATAFTALATALTSFSASNAFASTRLKAEQ